MEKLRLDVNMSRLGTAIAYFNMEYDPSDPHGSVMNWRFNIANELSRRGTNVPSKWEYKPGICGPYEPYDWDYDLTTMETVDLVTFGNLLYHFSGVIDKADMSY